MTALVVGCAMILAGLGCIAYLATQLHTYKAQQLEQARVTPQPQWLHETQPATTQTQQQDRSNVPHPAHTVSKGNA